MMQPKEPEPFEQYEEPCICHRTGWSFIQEEWVECLIHYEGQLHPQSRSLLLDDPIQLAETERVSVLNWKINHTRQQISELKDKLLKAQNNLLSLELELINKTPTIKMQVVNLLSENER